jgi:hypothetical protein
MDLTNARQHMALYEQKAGPTEHLNNNNCENKKHHELQHKQVLVYQGFQQKKDFKVIHVFTNESLFPVPSVSAFKITRLIFRHEEVKSIHSGMSI